MDRPLPSRHLCDVLPPNSYTVRLNFMETFFTVQVIILGFCVGGERPVRQSDTEIMSAPDKDDLSQDPRLGVDTIEDWYGLASKSPRTLAAMAIRGTERERWAASTHPNTPPQVLHLLAQDPSLADKVAQNPSATPTTLSLILTAHPRLVLHIVENPACSEKLLREQSKHEAPAVRTKIGQHHRCPVDVLETLAIDSDETVRTAAVGNPHCPMHSKVTAGLIGTSTPPLF